MDSGKVSFQLLETLVNYSGLGVFVCRLNQDCIKAKKQFAFTSIDSFIKNCSLSYSSPVLKQGFGIGGDAAISEIFEIAGVNSSVRLKLLFSKGLFESTSQHEVNDRIITVKSILQADYEESVFVGISGILKDVSGEFDALEKLVGLGEVMQSVFCQMGETIFLLDDKGFIERSYHNKTTSNLQADFVLGKHITELYRPGFYSVYILGALKRLTTVNKPVEIEFPVRHGLQRTWHKLRIAKRILPHSQHTAYTVIDSDITFQRRQQHEIVREQRISGFLKDALLRISKLDRPDFGSQLMGINEIVAETLRSEMVGFFLFADNYSFLKAVDIYSRKSLTHIEAYSRFLEVPGSLLQNALSWRCLTDNLPYGFYNSQSFPDEKDAGKKSSLQLPVWNNGILIGLYCIEIKNNTPNRWHPVVVDFLTSVADQVAVFYEAGKLEESEIKIAETERKFRFLFNSAADAILVVQKDGLVLDANQAAANLFNTAIESLVNESLSQLFQSFDFDVYSNFFQANTPFTIYNTFYNAKNKLIQLEISGNPVWIGAETQAMLMVRDITRRMKAENELRKSEERFRQLAENISDLVWIWEGEKIVYANRNFLNLWGISLEEALSKPELYFKIIHPDDLPLLFTAYNSNSFKTNHKMDVEFRVLSPQNEVITLWGRTFPVFNLQKQVYRVIGVASDISKQKKIENDLRELNIDKDKFFSIIAHDLRNPLNNLLGFSQLLTDNFKEYNEEKKMSFLRIIQQTAKSTGLLLDNLLEWSRLQTGRINAKPARYFLKPQVDECVQLLHSAALAKKISISTEIDMSVSFYADCNMVSTVLRNILSNAIKFTPISGEISIDAGIHENFVVVKISDTGVGMSELELKNLFLLDKSLSAKGTEGEVGSGLGLILCHEFVKKNRGSIEVKSKPGLGSTFIISLPANEMAYLASNI